MAEPKFSIPKIIKSVGTGLIAGMLYAGMPADNVFAQTRNTLEAEQTDISEAIKSSFEEAKKQFESGRRWIGDDDYIAQRKKIFEETQTLLQDPRYIAGIELIRKNGGKLKNFVGHIDPKVAIDLVKIQNALDSIPDRLKGKLDLSSGSIEYPEKQDYSKEGLFDLADFMHERGLVADLYSLNKFLEEEAKYPNLRNVAWRVHDATKGKMEMRFFPWLFERNRMPYSILDNEAVVDGIADLINRGVESYDIFPFSLWENEIPVFTQGLASKDNRDLWFKMLNFGYSKTLLKLSSVARWKPEMYNHPNFDKNAQLLAPRGQRDFSEFDFNKYTKVLMIDNLEDFITTIPVSGSFFSKDKMFEFFETIGDDTVAIEKARELAKLYPKNFGKVLFELTPVKLKDPEYLDILLKTWESGDLAENRQKTLIDVDVEYIQKKTGFGLRELVRDLQRFVTIYRDTNTTPVSREILEKFKRFAFASPIIRMNELHDENTQKRLEVLGTHDAKVLFEVMLTAGADAYLSTFRLLYNGNGQTNPSLLKYTFIYKVKNDTEFGSLYNFVKKLNPDKKDFGRILQFMSQHDLMDTFLNDIGGEEQQKEILTNYVFDIKNDLDTLQAVTLDDLLATTANKQIRDFIFSSFKDVVEGKIKVSKKQEATIKLLLTSAFRDAKDIPDWASQVIGEYGKFFPAVEVLSKDKMFRSEEGVLVNNQVHFFYDDRGANKPESTWDGHMSFRNFIVSLGGGVVWDKDGKIQRIGVGREYDIKDEGTYVIISKRYSDGKVIKMFVTKPDRSDQQVKEVGEKLLGEIKPQMVVHRGHSYHAGKTIKLLNPEVLLVNLGSCGGANNISGVLEKSPTTQVMATRNVGTMLVNDVLIRQINESLGLQNEVRWTPFRERMNTEFNNRGGLAKERWQSYLLPNQNRTAHLISALQALTKN